MSLKHEDVVPLKAIKTIIARWPEESSEIINSIDYDTLNGCWCFARWGMYFGIEENGEIHT